MSEYDYIPGPMIPVVFVNCDKVPYVDKIISGEKKYETRNRNMLGALVGRRVLIAETHRGKTPKIRCCAWICSPDEIIDKDTWNDFRGATCVPEGSYHDWNDRTKRKYLYYLLEVCEVYDTPWIEGKRHGITWMEFPGMIPKGCIGPKISATITAKQHL